MTSHTEIADVDVDQSCRTGWSACFRPVRPGLFRAAAAAAVLLLRSVIREGCCASTADWWATRRDEEGEKAKHIREKRRDTSSPALLSLIDPLNQAPWILLQGQAHLRSFALSYSVTLCMISHTSQYASRDEDMRAKQSCVSER
jgi:hypothetical protein